MGLKAKARMRRRLALYGGGTLLMGSLVYGGFIYQAQPDVLTLLGGADLHLRVAAMLPMNGKDGKPLAVREENLRRVEQALDQVERQSPGLSVTRQFRAYVAYLRNEPRVALGLYREAMAATDFVPAQRTRVLLDVAKLHQQLGEHAAALEVLATLQPGPDLAAEATLVRAQLLRSQGRHDAAAATLRALAAVPAEQGALVLECAQLLVELQDVPAAAALAGSARTRCDAQGLYRIAKLKFQAGEADTALSILEQAGRADSETVRAHLQRDRAFWDPVRQDPRFTNIEMLKPEPAAAPGR